MKKIITIFLMVLSMNTFAQQVELTGFYGYVLNGDLNTYYYGDFKFDDAPNYGGLLGVEMYKGGFIEFMYNRQDSKFAYEGLSVDNNTDIDMAVEYYQIGSSKQLDVHDIIKPFGSVTIGAVRFHPKESYDWDENGTSTYLDDEWCFGATLGAGVKLYLSEKIGIRLQARMLLPMEFSGLFVGMGTGGASAGATFLVPMISGDFTAGLILRLGKNPEGPNKPQL